MYEIALTLKKGVPESQIKSYIDSHYYEFTAFGQTLYTTSDEIRKSVAMVTYDKANNAIHFLSPDNYPWTDFNYTFGYTRDQLVSAFGEPLDENETTIAYFIDIKKIATSVFFTLNNSTKKVNAYRLLINANVSRDDVHKVLSSKYYYNKYFTEQDAYRYYDTEDTQKAKQLIIYQPQNRTIVVFDINNQ